MTAPRALVLLAPGAEEIETVTVVDVLRRAEIEVVLAGLRGPGPVRCSRGVVLVPDAALDAVTGPFDAVVVPGGRGGTDALAADARVLRLLREQAAAGRLVAALCAGPEVLAAAGLAAGRRLTSHPSSRAVLEGETTYVDEPVVVDGALVTSRGPGTALAFALALVAELLGPERAASVATPMVLP